MRLRFNKIPLTASWGRDCRKVRAALGNPMKRLLWSPRLVMTVVWPRVATLESMKNGWTELTRYADESSVPTTIWGLRTGGGPCPSTKLGPRAPCPSRHLLQSGPPASHGSLILPALLRGRGRHDSI